MLNLLSICLLGLVLANFIQLSYTQRQNPNCVPSACGNIQNISFPFRLGGDPQHCGNPSYELVCENNTTVLYLYSQRYHVQAINYLNYTIRLSDPSINDDTCSFPRYSLSNHFSDSRQEYPYGLHYYNGTQGFNMARIAFPATFLSCAHPINYSFYINTSSCDGGDEAATSSTRTYAYVKAGYLNASNVGDMCSIGLTMLISMPLKGYDNITLSEFHSCLLYGFELSWFSVLCENCMGIGACEWDGSGAICRKTSQSYCVIYNRVVRCDGIIMQHLLPIAETLFNTGPRIILELNLALRVVIGMPIILGLLICKLRRRHLSMFDVIEGYLQSQNNLGPIRYSYSDIKKMTKGFREKLGQGGFGSVYKGKLRSGRAVAVKVLSSKARGNGQDFMNEVGTIGRIHHVNVVKLVGYSSELSKRALVYDYMPNGSLEKYVLGKERTNTLDWNKKYDIAVGVARGIEYLHRGCDVQILHFDIKPHNILLDDNFTTKISDFGLAKFYPTDHNTVNLTAARGTIGYVAPELINRSIGNVSYKADVYSFGMMVMEMVGLKRDLQENAKDSSMFFPYWIYNHLDKWKDVEFGKAHEIATTTTDEDNDDDEKITRKMAIVALWCIQMSPGDRPSMTQVVEMLEGDVGSLRVPPRPSYSPQIQHNGVHTGESYTTDSSSLLPYGRSRHI